jgi:uncharacterized protein (DUF1330 family)
MNANFKIALAVAVGAALGAAAMQGLHAQAKPKAYHVVELEVLDATADASLLPLTLAAVKAAGGRNLATTDGRTIAVFGEPPKRVAINEFDSLEQAQAFFNSAARKNLAPQAAKAIKVIRSYLVEGAAN